MKRIMSLMLGLTLVLGTAAFAADEKPAAGEKKATKKKAKKSDAKKAEKTEKTTPAPATK